MIKNYILCFSWLYFVVDASIFCPYLKYPSSDADFRTVSIQQKERSEQESMYRISDDENDQGFSSKSESFRLITSIDNTECPVRSCLTELSASEPKHHGSVLYHTSLLGKVIPPGFQAMDASRRVYCVIFEGDCGATLPIYRYYRVTSGGIYHAYALDDQKSIANYTREPTPLCYAWSAQRQPDSTTISSTEATTEKHTTVKIAKDNVVSSHEGSCLNKLPSGYSMKVLRVYDNHRSGPMRDHYYTTRNIDDNDVQDVNGIYYNYTLSNEMGTIVVDNKESGCGCLVKLTQMLEHSDGIIRVLDHKLMMEGEEISPATRLIINQTATGEELYCVKEEGSCGATIPLRKYYHIGDLDTIYTVNSTEIPLFTIPTPTVLCYIWPVDTLKNLKNSTIVKPETETILGVRYIIDSKNNSLRH